MAVKRLPDATEMADKMIRNVSNAGSDWEKGMQNPSRSITGEMKKAAGRYASETTKAITEKRWDKGIAKLTDDGIAAQAIKVGGGRLVEGVRAREDKIRQAYTELQPKLQAHVARIDAMKNDTDADREQRMVENLRGMKSLRKT